MPPGGLGLLVSQSGETADTLAALRYMRAEGQHVLSIVNVPESSMARESDAVLETVAGPEIGVASTKAFTAQLAVLACLALAAGAGARHADRGAGGGDDARAAGSARPRRRDARARRRASAASPPRVAEARDVLYLGRGSCFPIAMEGALKLKEISYIHAEGYAAGEMKHGPIALIDRAVPVIAIVPSGPLFEKTASQPAGGGGARRPGDRVQRRGGRGEAARASPPRRSCCRRSIRSWRRSCTPSRCSCWPTTWRC